MTPKETLKEVRMVKRTELYNSILSIVKQIPRKEVKDDAMDAPSCTYELEQLFLKLQQERMYSEEEVLDILFSMSVDNPNDITEWFEKFKKK